MTSAQSRAARGLLSLSQGALAAKASLGLSTVVDFERGRRVVSAAAIAVIRSALESAGVEFIPENGGGAGVRLKIFVDPALPALIRYPDGRVEQTYTFEEAARHVLGFDPEKRARVTIESGGRVFTNGDFDRLYRGPQPTATIAPDDLNASNDE